MSNSFSQTEHIGIFEGNTDVGAVKHAGSATYNAEKQQYILEGSGLNMWYKKDEFHMTYKKMTGDFILQAKVEFVGEGVDPHRKIGWIVRPNFEISAPYADIAIHGDGLTSLQYRRGPGDSTYQVVSGIAYATQLLQADYLRYAIETHRRGRPYCMGSMYWQLNDLWPVTSWASIDYYGRWKASHYAAQQAYAPVLVTSSDAGGLLKVHVVNDLLEPRPASLALRLMDFSGEILWLEELEIAVPANTGMPVFETVKKSMFGDSDPSQLVWSARLLDGDVCLSENLHYFVHNKHLKLEAPEINFTIESEGDEYKITLISDKLTKNVMLKIEPDGKLSDNYFDLMPGSEKIVTFTTPKKWNRKLEFLHYFKISPTPSS